MPRGDRTEHLIGLLLGTEEDWPCAFEELVRRLGAVRHPDGTPHTLRTERITIEPFELRDCPRYDLVIDRLAYWYYHPREWLKKVALDGRRVPAEQPVHVPVDGEARGLLRDDPARAQGAGHPGWCRRRTRWTTRAGRTSSKYNRAFDLDAIATRVGYPLFMKPFDGGAWVGVSRSPMRPSCTRPTTSPGSG
jgi:hypothetical protein